jgi:hypothetical protein
MQNCLYQGLIVSSKDSPDAATPHEILVTQEANGYALWECDYYGGTRMFKWFYAAERDIALEEGVALAKRRRKELKGEAP